MTLPNLLFTESVIGFRTWRVHQSGDGKLLPYGLVTAPPWRPGVNKAFCYRYNPHPMTMMYTQEVPPPAHEPDTAPLTECKCGFHAYHDLHPRRWELSRVSSGAVFRVVGAIEAWGCLQVHHAGFRARFARILALEIPSHSVDARLAEKAAKAYDVPFLEPEFLVLEAERHGRSLPHDIRPPGPARRRAE